MDLGKAAKEVENAATPHKSQAPPHLNVVLFAKLDKESAKKAEEAAGKLKGVDPKETKANAEKGEISVRIKGDEKITADKILDALKDAGVTATLTKDEKKK